MTAREHWDHVYETKNASEVSWYTQHLESSLRFIRDVATPEARIIDVGGGASTLVDDLVTSGFRHVTVLDISERALDVARARLGDRQHQANWLAADITQAQIGEASFDVWHDRAVFHFLTRAEAQAAYAATLLRSLAPGGHALIATFSLNGPPRCSGLDIVRYDAESLQRALGEGLELLEATEKVHVTPGGREQQFVECHFRRR